MTKNRARTLYTESEKEVLRFMFDNGRTDKEIGEALGRSGKSVAIARQRLGLLRADKPDFSSRMTPEEDLIIVTRTIEEAERLIPRKTRHQIVRRRGCLRETGKDKEIASAKDTPTIATPNGEPSGDARMIEVAAHLREINGHISRIADLLAGSGE